MSNVTTDAARQPALLTCRRVHSNAEWFSAHLAHDCMSDEYRMFYAGYGGFRGALKTDVPLTMSPLIHFALGAARGARWDLVRTTITQIFSTFVAIYVSLPDIMTAFAHLPRCFRFFCTYMDRKDAAYLQMALPKLMNCIHARNARFLLNLKGAGDESIASTLYPAFASGTPKRCTPRGALALRIVFERAVRIDEMRFARNVALER